MKGLRAALRRMAAVNSTVLITGESGTGKELAAPALHRQSPWQHAGGTGGCAHRRRHQPAAA